VQGKKKQKQKQKQTTKLQGVHCGSIAIFYLPDTTLLNGMM